jgi:hypothetical protein
MRGVWIGKIQAGRLRCALMAVLSAFAFLIALFFQLPLAVSQNHPTWRQDFPSVKLRRILHFSTHPNSREVLISEGSEGEVRPQTYVYNIETGETVYFEFDDHFYYFEPSFSPDGAKIVLRRGQFTAKTADEAQQVRFSDSIVVMDSDGSNGKVLYSGPGLKFSPVMSHSGRYIAFWQGTPRPTGSKTFASRYDVWELDTQSGRVNLFAAEYQFFGADNLQYFRDDRRLLVNGDSPMAPAPDPRFNQFISARAGNSGRNDKFSNIFALERGDRAWREPLWWGGVEYPQSASLNLDDTLYFQGFKPTTSFFSLSDSMVQRKINRPWGNNFYYPRILPNGSGALFLFITGPGPLFRQRALGLYRLEENIISLLTIPDRTSSNSVRHVRFHDSAIDGTGR